ncbi:MAG TPA: hypothetical protein VL988_01255 [Solirubrobacteraceae bacterium]|nr:hypothetical protein [Solirubrobacteraceae bacterium]
MARRSGVLVGALLALALLAQSASAAETTVGCAGLQTALNNANAGDVVTLGELCKSGFPYKLPAVQMTLRGAPGAGFDGGSTVQLEGLGASPTLEGLVFENAHSSGSNTGGALTINAAPHGSTIALVSDTFTNDVASGGEGGGARVNTSEAKVIVSGSTFTGDSAAGAGGGLEIFASEASLSGDTFTGNATTGASSVAGGLLAETNEGPIALSNSRFSENTAVSVGGGAELATPGQAAGFTLIGNTFSHNSVSDPAGVSKSGGYLGGGLALAGQGAQATSAVQRGNTFDGNSVSFKAAPVMAWGGGESAFRVALQSTGDKFTNNTLQSPSEAKGEKGEKVFGWGAGLSIAQCGDLGEEPPSEANVVSTLSDAVVAGNTLLSGPSAGGAGIYVGIVCKISYSTLQLNDSTVSGNAISGASGPVAGISGGPRDVLALANTIVYGDSGGPELGGFQGLSGASATYSDVCSGNAPFAGEGNICADPLLAGPGPDSADVRETATSPTLERGSNGLIPAGLTTDVFGGPRVLGPVFCGTSPPAVVDIGAFEYAYPAPVCPPLIISSHPQPPLAPALSALGQTAKTWREGSSLAQLSASGGKGKGRRKVPVGTTFSFKLDRAARVTFAFTHAVAGRRVGKRCVAQTRRNRGKRRCARTIVAGTLVFSAHAGTNKVRFQGLISKRRKLKPGSYRLLVSASDAGQRSRTATLGFTIVR